MAKWVDYLVSKEKCIPNTKRIYSFIIYIDLGDTASEKSYEVRRSWIVQQIEKEKFFCYIFRNEEGRWSQGNSLILSTKGRLSWLMAKEIQN